jgi:hypothetical protein
MLVRPALLTPFRAACAALAATLLLGLGGPAIALPAAWLPWEAFGLAVVGSSGLLAWHLAQSSALPAPAGGLARAALPAALLPLLAVPHAGAAMLVVPALLAAALLRQARLAAALALSGLAALPWQDWFAAGYGAATILAAAWLLRPRCPAANDNPSMERVFPFWRVPEPLPYAMPMCRDSLSGNGE